MGTFLQRHVVASLFGAIGVLLAGLGYADQAGAIATTYEPWQLQACGAALFVIFVVRVLVSYDQTQVAKPLPVDEPSDVLPANDEHQNGTLAAASLVTDADILPAAISKEYLAFITTRPTQLQIRKMMKPYEGKWLILDMQLQSLTERSKDIAALMDYTSKGKSSDLVWVSFGKEWEDHLHKVNKSAKLRFKGRIKVGETGLPEFVDAVPLL